MARYTRIDSGLDDHGRPWQVGLSNRVDRPPTLVIAVPEGTAALYFNGDERDRFAHAVARASLPEQKPLPRAAKCPRCGLPDGDKPVVARPCEHIWHRFLAQAAIEGQRRG